MTPKALIASWTFWFGLLQVLLGAVGWLSGLMQTTEALTLVTTGIGTIGLRVKTTQPVSGIISAE